MSRQKMDKEKLRKIQSSKGSYFVTLPINKMRELGWKNGHKVIIKKWGDGFVIGDWKPVKKKIC